MEINEIEKSWEQNFVKHCPKKECKGMLLQSKYCYELKCSDCNKYFMSFTETREVELNLEQFADSKGDKQ